MVSKMLLLFHVTLAFDYVTANARRKIVILTRPEDIAVFPGERIQLKCETSGLPPPTVIWYKNTNRVTYVTDEVVQLPDDSLVIPKASLERDVGEYQCIATNTYETAFGTKVKVNVKHLEEKFRADPKDVNTTIMSFALIKCMPPGAYPPIIVTWYKDGVTVKKRDDIVIYADGTGDSVLRIGNVLYSDRGLYACLAENELGTRESNSGYLNVFVPPPRLHDSSPVVRAFAGDSVSLYCESMFEPQPRREWGKLIGVPPDKDRIQITPTGEYVIRNAVVYDSGSYMCTASNEAGSVQKTVNLTVYTKPTFVRQPTNMKVPVGSNATLECGIAGGWEPRVWWRKGDRHRSVYKPGVFRTDSDRILLLANNELRILKATIDDSGEYECVVNDNYDVALSAKATLTVTDDVALPLPSMIMYPSNQTVKAGDDVSLFCDVSNSVDPPAVRWESAADVSLIKPGVLGFQFKQDKQVYQLIINAVSRKDGGVYRCIATNSAGTTMQSALVIVEAGPQAPEPIKNLKVTALNATSVELSWAPPDTHYLAQIEAYIITIEDVLRNLQQKTFTAHTSRIVSNLQPATSYKFAVVAKNKYGASSAVVSQVVLTLSLTDVTASPPDSTKPTKDRLLDVMLYPTLDGVSASSANISWNAVASSRINGFIVYYQKDGDSIFSEQVITRSDAQKYVLEGLLSNTIYSVKMRAYNREYHAPMSKVITLRTLHRIPLMAPVNVQITRRSASSLSVRWDDPDNMHLFPEVVGFEVAWQTVQSNASFFVMTVPKDIHSVTLHDLETWTGYQIYVSAKTSSEAGQRVGIHNVVIGSLPQVLPDSTLSPLNRAPTKKGSVGADVLKVVKEPWFIATCGVLLWIILLVVVICICCKRVKKKKMSRSDPFSKHRLLNDSRRSDYPNTSLSRARSAVRDNSFVWNGAHAHDEASLGRGTMKSCCKSQDSSVDDDFPNKADVKPSIPYRQESLEMKTKTSNVDLSRPKDTNIRMALENGYRDPLLNNKRQFVDLPSRGYDQMYDSGPDESRSRPKILDSLESESAPKSDSMPRKDDPTKTNSAERRHEIVRTAATKKSFPDAELVNVMENNPQASWKREQSKDSTRAGKPPGDETLRRRREGKNAYKPIPRLESVRLTDGLIQSSKPLSVVDESQTGSPKMSPSTSVLSENQDGRDSRLSHDGSSASLSKEEKPGQVHVRRMSNASSMMSSELYQSEMDPAYSDHVSDRRRRREKPVPPPIDLEGLTSDILLQWAESVTNSSPSSSGSSSPSRLSAISSDGSFYTDEDFAQAVAAVAECRGFSMDYDYSLPGMPGALGHLPLSSRNEKMNRIDEMLAKSKSRNSPASTQSKFRYDQPSVPPSYPHVPQLSFTNYLPGAQKSAVPSLLSSSSGATKPRHLRSGNALESSARYGTGLQDIDSVLGKPSPLTVSNLMHHDSSLERGKKPLTVSNLRQHETSLDREKRHHKPIDKIPSHLIDRRGPSGGRREKDPSKMSPRYDRSAEEVAKPPEPPLSVTSALERNESINSRDSATSSNKNDSELENPNGRKTKRRKERTSSTSTGSTVRTSPDVDELEQDAIDC